MDSFPGAVSGITDTKICVFQFDPWSLVRYIMNVLYDYIHGSERRRMVDLYKGSSGSKQQPLPFWSSYL